LAILFLAGPVVLAEDKLEASYQDLKQAVDRKDAARVKELVAQVYAVICEETATAAPSDADEKRAWTDRREYLKGIEVFTEYALFATAIQSQPPVLVDLISALEQQNPKSKYLDEAYGSYLVALNQTGAASKIPAIAEKALASFPDNPDLLLLLADTSVTRKQPDRALAYANRLTAAIGRRGKPENLSAADWERKRSAGLGRGYWIAGCIYAEKGQYVAADKNLRAALPFIKANDAMSGPALFYLGMANYQVGKMTNDKSKVLDAARFSEQAAAISGPFADQARHNALVMKNEAGAMR
jgi:hypothetical protein